MDSDINNANAITRKDGRTPLQLRAIEIEQGGLNRADGSARYTLDNSSVIVVIYGPAPVKPRQEKIDRSTVEIVWAPSDGVTTYIQKSYEQILQSTLESVIITTLHPRSLLSVIVQVIGGDRGTGSSEGLSISMNSNEESDTIKFAQSNRNRPKAALGLGGLLSMAVNCCTLALLDCGIEMNGLVVSVCCAVTKEGTLLIDPTADEEKAAAATLTVGFPSSFEGELFVKTVGMFEENDFFTCLESCRKAAKKVLEFMRLSMERRVVVKDDKKKSIKEEIKEEVS